MADVAELRTPLKVEARENPLKSLRLSQQLQSSRLRASFINAIFDIQLDPAGIHRWDHGLEAFFSRYATLCSLAANTNRATENFTHWQLASIINLLKNPDEAWRSRLQLVELILSSLQFTWDESMVGEYLAPVILDLAVDVWSMLSVGKFSGDVSYDEPISWENNETLSKLIGKCFPLIPESQDTVKLPQAFTAAHLEKIGGIQVIWTSNLADHLLLKEDDTKLMLFHQVSILRMHKLLSNSLFPEDLVEETIRTISLLVPPVLGEPNPWLRRQQQMHKIDAQAGNCNRLNSSQRQIKHFAYWRDRLVLLKRTFDDAEPRSLSQLWWDDRKKTQWFTFWVAVLVFILTLFFGIVQSVASIVQAWASVRSLEAQNASNTKSS